MPTDDGEITVRLVQLAMEHADRTGLRVESAADEVAQVYGRLRMVVIKVDKALDGA